MGDNESLSSGFSSTETSRDNSLQLDEMCSLNFNHKTKKTSRCYNEEETRCSCPNSHKTEQLQRENSFLKSRIIALEMNMAQTLNENALLRAEMTNRMDNKFTQESASYVQTMNANKDSFAESDVLRDKEVNEKKRQSSFNEIFKETAPKPAK